MTASTILNVGLFFVLLQKDLNHMYKNLSAVKSLSRMDLADAGE